MSKTSGVGVGGMGFRTKDKAGVTVVVFTQEFHPRRAQLRFPVDVLGVEFTGH